MNQVEKTNRGNQIKNGILLSYLTLAVSFFSQLLITPIIIDAIGPAEHGVYTMAVSIVNYLNLLSFGISSSYIKFYAKACNSEDIDEVRKLNGSLFFIFSVIATVLFIVGFVVANFSDKMVQNTFTSNEIASLKKIILVLTVNLSFTFLGSVHNSYIIAHERFTFQKAIALIKAIILPVFSVALVYVGLKSISLAIAMVIAAQFVNFAYIYYAYKHLNFSMKVQVPTAAFLRSLFSYSGYIFLIMIVDQVNWNVDKLLLGSMVSATAVSVYGVGAQFNDFFKTLSTSISSMYTPAIHKLEVSGNSQDVINNKLTDIMIKAGRIQFLIIMLVYTGFIFFGRMFIDAWVGEIYQEAYYVALLILGSEIVPLIENVAVEIRRAKNKQKIPTIVSVAKVPLNLIISIILCKKYGPTGCAIGTTVSMILGSCFLNFYYSSALKLNMKLYWKNILLIAKTLILPCLFGIFLSVSLTIEGFKQIFVYAAIYTLIYMLSALLFGLSKSEKERIKDIFRKFGVIK